ncbi:MAG: hypothetical protein PHW55_11435 [Methanothrix sp.]|nr:hypothetical protein [Methanothrix sp.]
MALTENQRSSVRWLLEVVGTSYSVSKATDEFVSSGYEPDEARMLAQEYRKQADKVEKFIESLEI